MADQQDILDLDHVKNNLSTVIHKDGDNTGSVGLLLRRVGLNMSIAGLSPGGINQWMS